MPCFEVPPIKMMRDNKRYILDVSSVDSAQLSDYCQDPLMPPEGASP